MMGTTPSCAYCSGGDYAYAIMEMINKQTVELESNYPYEDREKYNQSSDLEPKLPPEQFELPFTLHLDGS